MSQIETARGPRDVSTLGQTLMHEHLFILDRELEANYLNRFDEKVEVSRAVQLVNDAASRGVGTIVDLTVLGIGRYVQLIGAVAERVDVAIVVATGLYTWDDVPMYFRFRGPGKMIDDGTDVMADFFVRDLTEGIAETGVKAAVLKCATDQPGFTEGVRRVFESVARAHLETGAPIATHTNAACRQGLEQQTILKKHGVDLSQVVIGHCGDSTDLDYLRELMNVGSYIGMDRFGNDLILPLDERVATVAALCGEGYSERMVLSHDSSCFSDALLPEDKQRLLPGWDYTLIHDRVLPRLRESGVTEDQIKQMLVRNPANLLARK